jgi:hypothetical protein
MPHYLIQGSYTAEAWQALLNKPEDRKEALRPVIEKLGGALRALETTPLLEFAEGLEAMKRASTAGYRPPGK